MSGSPDLLMEYEQNGSLEELGGRLAAGGGTGGSGAGAGGDGSGPGNGAPPKRSRVLLSCAPCRLSKLKCDRAVPCSNCLKKGRADVCAYAPRPKKPLKPATGMAARLRRLEGMLREMMDDEQHQQHLSGLGGPGGASSSVAGWQDGTARGGAFSGTGVSTDYAEAAATSMPAPSSGPASESAARAAAAVAAAAAGDDEIEMTGGAGKGRVVRGARTTTYVGATHFMAMLDDIEDLKSYFDWPDRDEQAEEEGSTGGDGESSGNSPEFDTPENVILQVRSLRSKDDLLAIMPPRQVVDRLIMRYFASNTPTQHTIHRPTFAKHYAVFWQDPTKADTEWFAVLFAIMAMGVHFSTFSAPHELQYDSSMTALQRFKLYTTAASRAMAASKFTTPSIRTVQGMLLFVESEFLLNRASQTNCWLLSGVTVRLMLNMGMHRDPSKLPNISAFEGEIRRRMWNLAIQLDLISSFHMGLPSMIHGIPSDTTLAHNLTDEDFGEDSAVLPPARPDGEYTSMSYPIFKSMVCRVFGRVARLSHALTPPTYAEVLRTDTLLADTWRRVPEFMKMKPLGNSVADPPVQVIQRFGLASLYQKSRCVLHRRYLAEAVPRAEHLYSRRTCLQAALDLLEYHEAIHDATKPGGLLHSMGWFITCLGMHDFLLAAMIVYLVVQNEAQFEGELLLVDSPSPPPAYQGGGMGTASTGTSYDYDYEHDPGTTRTGIAASTAANTATSTGSDASPQKDESAFGGLARSLPVERSELVALLRRSCLIWVDVAKTTPEVKKAEVLLDAMLDKIDKRTEELHRERHERPDEQPTPSVAGPQTVQSSSGMGTVPSTTETDVSGGTTDSGNSGGVFLRTADVPPFTNLRLPEAPSTEPSPSDLSGLPALDLGDVQVGFSRRDLVPSMPSPMPPTTAGLDDTLDAWFPMNLDSLDWGTVDDGLRNTSNQPSEWMESSNTDDLNYLGSGLWDHPDGAIE